MYELQNIELLAAEILKTPANRSPRDYETIATHIYEERDRIILGFKQQLLSQENETLLRRFFRIHQQGIVDLIGRIFAFNRTLKNKSTGNGLTEAFQNTLNQLLDVLQIEYAQYFDFHGKAPEPYLRNAIKRIEKNADDLFHRLHQDRRLEQSLRDSIHVLFDRNTIRQTTFSFHRVNYYERILPTLQMIVDATDDQELIQGICTVLIRNNFNTAAFLRYYTAYLTQSMEECETVTDKIDLASWQSKKINQMDVTRNVAYDNSVGHIKDQLLEWLTHELEYLRQKQGTVGPMKDELIRKDFKLQFDMSVAQLSFLFRAFVDTGVLQNKNTSELIRFVTKFITTKKSETVSYDSFRLKFYNTETGTKDAVTNMLQKLQSYITRN